MKRKDVTAYVTAWFPNYIKPVRVGVYQRKYHNGCPGFAWFDGEDWGLWARTVEDATFWKTKLTAFSLLPWRGLSKEPK